MCETQRAGVERGRILIEAVSLEEHARVAAERDEYRRALALLNMTRVRGGGEIGEPVRSQIDRILRSVGMEWADGQAVASIAASLGGGEV